MAVAGPSLNTEGRGVRGRDVTCGAEARDPSRWCSARRPADRNPGQLSTLTTSRGEIHEKIVDASKYRSKAQVSGGSRLAGDASRPGGCPFPTVSPRPLLCCGVNVSEPPVRGFPLATASMPLEGLLAIGAEQAGAGSPQTRGPVTGSGVAPVLQAEFPFIMHWGL